MSISNNIKTALQNALYRGYTIKIPSTEITYHAWQGTGFILTDPDTGASGYMLSGDIAGGSSAVDPVNWPEETKEALENPYSESAEKIEISDIESLDDALINIISASNNNTGTAGQYLDDPIAIYIRTTDGKAVENVGIIFNIIEGNGKLSNINGSEELGTISAETNASGLAKARLKLGADTGISPRYFKLNESDTYTTMVGLNLINATLSLPIGSKSLDRPIMAYGKPGPANTLDIVMQPDPNDKKEPNKFAGGIWVKPADQYGNPVSNIPVTFTVGAYTDLDTNTTGTPVPAKVYLPDDCPVPLPTQADNCGSSTIDVTSNDRGALAQIIMGNLDNTEYTFTAQAVGLPVQTFTAVTVNLPDDYTYANVVLPRIIIEQLETVNQRGNIVDAAGVGKQLDGGLQAKITVTEEDHDIVFGTWTQDNCTEDCQFDSWFFVGKGTYSTVTLTPTSRPTPAANAPNADITVNYSVTSGGGIVNPVTQANLTDGIYTTDLTVGSTPGENTVQISATAVYPIKWLKPDPDDTNGRAYLNEIEYKTDQNPSVTPLTKTVYGIKGEIINIVPAYIPLSSEGYVLEQAVINYRILPETYEVVNTYMNLYEDNLPSGSLAANGNINTGTAIIYQGAQFDPAKTYEAELVLDIGAEEEVKSEKVGVKVFALEIDGKFKIIENETTLSEITDGGEKTFKTLGGMRLHLIAKINDSINVTEYEWSSTDGRFYNGYASDAQELAVNDLKGDSLTDIYWQGDYVTTLNETIILKLTLDDGSTVEETRKVKSRILNTDTKGDDVKMLQAFLRLIGISTGETAGVRGSAVDIDGDFGSKTKKAVERFQKRDEIVVDGEVESQFLSKLELHWNDYLTAFESLPTSPKVNKNHPDFPTWISAGGEELKKTYTDEIQQSVDPDTTREEILTAWINKETGIYGHWGYNVNFRITLGAGDERGSIGFSQIQNRYKYGEGSITSGLNGVNLYHPEDGIKGFAIWSNDISLGGGFYRSFISALYKITKNYDGNIYPRIGVSYTDDNKDLLSKAIMEYNLGAGFSGFSNMVWSEILKDYDPPTPTAIGIRKAIQYTISIQKNAGLPLKEWTWADKEGETEFSFTYSEEEWLSGKTWEQKRNNSLP